MHKRLLILPILVLGCTPREKAQWNEWFNQDPEAAVAFAKELDEQTPEPEPQTSSTSVWDRVAECESGQNWSYNGGSGYDGGLQFLPATWRAYGGREFAEYAYQASREEQIIVAERVLDDVGWQAWPACSRKLGLR